MKVFIFLGPTLSWEEARKELDATYLPPVAQGDLYRAAKEKPFAIGIIDGYFERLPAVWHKEILWALSQRIHVFGAASMGALRAAELARFGMQGIGEIFRAFSSGELEDDDEVAVAHGDESLGFRRASEAMVNMRATLALAEGKGAVTGDLRRHLETIAKNTFYPERSYRQLWVCGRREGISEQELEALRAFVVSNRVDQKRLDALALLRAVRDRCSTGVAPESPAFTFQHTEAWDQVVDWAETQPPISLETTTLPAELMAAEVRMLGEKGHGILTGGYARLAAGELARRRPVPDGKDRLAKLDRSFREHHGVCKDDDSGNGEQFAGWLEAHGLTPETYSDFLERQVQLDWLKEQHQSDLGRYLVDELRRTGNYSQVARRATNKERMLAQHGYTAPTLGDAGVTQSDLFVWYFKHRLGRRVPHDMGEFLVDVGLANVAALEQEALRELLYARLMKGKNFEDLGYGNDPGNLQRPNASS
jgi:hypothetical protein